jgi:hypothetical protein
MPNDIKTLSVPTAAAAPEASIKAKVPIIRKAVRNVVSH